jgi:glutamine amidotransferase
MCLLTYMPDTVTLSYERARKSAINNPDGFGFAIHTGKAILTDHDMDFEKLWDRFDKARKIQPGPALFHFRIATHGEIDTSNCHPFYIGDSTDSVVAHNGMLPIVVPQGERRSDTRLFAELVLPHCGGVPRLDEDEFFTELSEWSTGSKLVILTTDPEAKHDSYIVNEKAGHWNSGVWWSNHSYEPYIYKPYGNSYSHMYGSYSSGWTASSKPSTSPVKFEYNYDDDPYDYVGDDFDEPYSNNEVRQLVAEELYSDPETLAQIEIFTEYVGLEYAMVTCYQCSSTYMVDPLEPSPTHCSHCDACLACSCQDNTCNCWTHYEHGQSFTPSFDLDDSTISTYQSREDLEW